jgi:hypothetical protein
MIGERWRTSVGGESWSTGSVTGSGGDLAPGVLLLRGRCCGGGLGGGAAVGVLWRQMSCCAGGGVVKGRVASAAPPGKRKGERSARVAKVSLHEPVSCKLSCKLSDREEISDQSDREELVEEEAENCAEVEIAKASW